MSFVSCLFILTTPLVNILFSTSDTYQSRGFVHFFCSTVMSLSQTKLAKRAPSEHTPDVTYAVYVIANTIGVYHVDVTHNLRETIEHHKNDRDPHRFTSRYDLRELRYYELYSTLKAARRRAEALRVSTKEHMMRCIARMNPTGECLYEKLCQGEQQPVLVRVPMERSTKKATRRVETREILRVPRPVPTPAE